MPADARATLAASQGRLVAALGGKAVPPAGFDAARVELTGRTLLAKRRKGVARTWPALAASLGDRFAQRFSAYATDAPPHPGGPAADGNSFARWLDLTRQLPAAAVAEFMLATLWRGRRAGIALRRVDGRLLAGVRLPLLGVRLLSLPPWRRPDHRT